MSLQKRLNSLQLLPLLTAVMTALATGCSKDSTETFSGSLDPETVPTMMTRDVETLISDSGVMRYKIVTSLWLVYDEAKVPKWRFPEGLHLDRYDNFFNREATVDCDSAIYFKDQQLWRLDGNVRVVNMAGEKFLTQQLFWDQRREEVYSDSFIQIERTDRMMEGYGFTSNSQMTKFKVKNVSAILPMEQFKQKEVEVNDTITTEAEADSITTRRRPMRERREE